MPHRQTPSSPGRAATPAKMVPTIWLILLLRLASLVSAASFTNPMSYLIAKQPYVVFGEDGYWYYMYTSYWEIKITRATSLDGLKQQGQNKTIIPKLDNDRNYYNPKLYKIDNVYAPFEAADFDFQHQSKGADKYEAGGYTSQRRPTPSFCLPREPRTFTPSKVCTDISCVLKGIPSINGCRRRRHGPGQVLESCQDRQPDKRPTSPVRRPALLHQ